MPPHKNVINCFSQVKLNDNQVVTFLGVCTEKMLCIVSEFLPLGNLLNYLQHAKLDTNKIIKMGKDIRYSRFTSMLLTLNSAGMNHLHQEGVVHRDLAGMLQITNNIN